MKEIYYVYIFAFLLSFFISLVVTPLTKTLAKEFNIQAIPNERSMHKEPTGLLGGVAIFSGFMITILICILFIPDFRTLQFYGFIVGGFIIFILGIIDDKYALSSKVKLLGQIIVALVVINTGTTISVQSWPVPNFVHNYDSFFTFLWIIGIVNAINIIDGVDGLAAGVSAISSLCMAVLCFISGSPTAVILSAALAGSTLGFLPRNFHPAEVFMGDNGAMFLGYVLAVSSIIGVYKEYAFLSIVISFLVLAFPIFDVSFAILRRAKNGKPIMVADRGHLHHKLYDKGFSERHTVSILYCITIVTGGLSIVLALDNLITTVVVFTFIIILFVVVFSYQRRVAQKNKKKYETKPINKVIEEVNAIENANSVNILDDESLENNLEETINNKED